MRGKYKRALLFKLHQTFSFLPTLKYNYPDIVAHFFAPEDRWENVYPTIFPGWDRTPRTNDSEGVYINSTPENFRRHLEQALQVVAHKPLEHRILFLRAWNEWAEGNYVELDEIAVTFPPSYEYDHLKAGRAHASQPLSFHREG